MNSVAKLAAAALCVALFGCGGGSEAILPPPVTTPAAAPAPQLAPDFSIANALLQMKMDEATQKAADDYDAAARAALFSAARNGLTCGSVHFDLVAAAAQEVARTASLAMHTASFTIAATGTPINPADWGALFDVWHADLKSLLDLRYAASMASCLSAGVDSWFQARRRDIAATVDDEVGRVKAALRSAGYLSP